MKKYSLLIFVSFSVLLQTCDKKESCENQLFIVQAQDSIPVLKVETGDSYDRIISKLLDAFEEETEDELCYKEKEIGILLTEKIIKCHFTFYCPIKTSRIPTPSEVRLLINDRKKVLINSETIIDIDSLENWIIKNYTIEHFSDLYKKEIAIFWNTLTPAENLELALIEIVKGLQSKYDTISKDQFEMTYCELNAEQAAEIDQAFPVKIVFDIGVAPPPPPPPIDRNK